MLVYKITETGEAIADRGFSYNNTTYPPGWLSLATAQDLADHGIEAVDVPDPAPEPAEAVVPSEISAAQARVHLRRSGLRDQVEALVASSSDEIRDWYEYASVWHRENTNVAAMSSMIGLSSDQVDELFVAAAKI